MCVWGGVCHNCVLLEKETFELATQQVIKQEHGKIILMYTIA